MDKKQLEQKANEIINNIKWDQSMFNRFPNSSMTLKSKELNKELTLEISDKWMRTFVDWINDMSVFSERFIVAIMEAVGKELIKQYDVKLDKTDEENFFKWWKPLHEIGALDAEAQSYGMTDAEICRSYCERELWSSTILETKLIGEVDINKFKEMFKNGWIMNQEATDDKVDVDDDVYLQYMITLQNGFAFNLNFLNYIKSNLKIKLDFKNFNVGENSKQQESVKQLLIKLVDSTFNA